MRMRRKKGDENDDSIGDPIFNIIYGHKHI